MWIVFGYYLVLDKVVDIGNDGPPFFYNAVDTSKENHFLDDVSFIGD